MREKLRIFPFGQYIVGNVVFLAFRRHSQVQNRHGGCEEMYKNVNTVSDGYARARRIDDVIIVGRRLLRKYITSEVLT